MRKPIVRMLVFLLALMLSCAGGTTVALAEQSEEIIELTYMTTTSQDKSYVTELFEEYEAEHPNIRIKAILVPYEEFTEKLSTMIASQTMPDITSCWGNTGFAEYYTQGLIQPMDEYMEETGFSAEEVGIPQESMDVFKVDGKQYGVPVYAYTSFMLYNKDMFDAAGLEYPPSDYEDTSWTWDKMMEYARELTVHNDNPMLSQYGLFFNWGIAYEQSVQYFGGKLYDDDAWTNGGIATECYVDSAEAMQAFQIQADLTTKDMVSPPKDYLQSLGSSVDNPFYLGKVGMYTDGGWIITSIADCDFNVGIAAIPKYGDSYYRDVTYMDPLMIMRDCQHPKEAFDLIAWLVSADVSSRAVELSGGTPPANTKAADAYYNLFTQYGIDAEDMKKVMEGGFKYGFECWVHLLNDHQPLVTMFGNEIGAVVNGDSKIEDVAPDLQKRVQAYLTESAEKWSKE